MTQIATDPSQSERLKACGVDPKSADLVWMDDKPSPRLTLRTEIIEDNNPYIVAVCWSLSALIALFPMEINDEGLQTVFQLTPYPDELKWAAEYYDYTMDKYLCSQRDYNPIEACVKAIEYITQNGYKLNGIMH